MEHSNPENIWFTIFSSCLFMFVLLKACAFGSISVRACACMSVLIYSKDKLFWKDIIHTLMKEHYPSLKFGSKPALDTDCHIGLNQSVETMFSKYWESPSLDWSIARKVMDNKKDPSFAASLNPQLYIKQMSFLQYAMCRLRNCIS